MIFAAAGLILFPLMMAYAASSDLVTMTISNRLNIALVLSYFALAVVTDQNLDTILVHVACGLCMLVITFSLFCAGWMGGGDAKLASGIALWMGFPLSIEYALAASFLGGVLTIAILLARTKPLPEILLKQNWIARLHDKKTGIPYGIALAAGGLLLYPKTSIWISIINL